MTIRRHGVIGGPRNLKPIRPRTKVNHPQEKQISNSDEEPQAIVVSHIDDEKILSRKFLRETEDEDYSVPPVEVEETIDEDTICKFCKFVAKSDSGLKVHISRMHSELLKRSSESK